MKANKTESKYAYIEGVVSVIINILLFVLKYWAGVVSGSIALLADAWHTLSDSVSSLVVILGVKISTKPADKQHPYGHGRADLIAAVVIGVLLSIVAFEFILESVDKFNNHSSANYGTIAIVVTIVSVLLKEALAQFAFWAGRKSKSETVKADGWHHRSDAISSMVILVGIFIGKYFWWIDAALGIIVAIMIGHAAYEILQKTFSILLGEAPKEEFIKELKITINTEAKNKDIKLHHIHLHHYGNHSEVTFHIRLDGEMKLKDSAKFVVRLQKAIRKKMQIEATIHVDAL